MVKNLKRLHAFARSFASSQPPKFLAALKKEFPGAEVYLVGGCVRDALLGRKTKDIDLVVRTVPAKKLEKLLGRFGSVNLVGKKFGVFKFVPKGAKTARAIDIALPRTEFSIGNTGHYRDFAIQTDHRMSIEADLARRDFTVNAMAYSLFEKTLVDPWNGSADLSARLIRAVGDPHYRFAEDYSRMLRAIRFACQLDFDMHPHTRRAIKERIGEINKKVKVGRETFRAVPYEIVSREMIKAFVADPVFAFDFFDALGVFSAVMPELLAMKKCPQPKEWHSEGDVWAHTRLALEALSSKKFKAEFGDEQPDALCVLALLLHDIGKPATIQKPKKRSGRIRFEGHDHVGAEMARAMCERLKTASVEEYNVDPAAIYWLTRNHLVLLNADVAKLKNTTIEKYFYRDPYLGTTLLKLTVADGLGSIRKDGKVGLDRYRAFKRRLKKFEQTARARKHELPKPILDGDEIMTIARIKPGKEVGALVDLLREEQLAGRVRTKKAGKDFVFRVSSRAKRSEVEGSTQSSV
ncbi:CCA tRNA nucleotidyltransferase [Candidatus Uhrbacteria bacterium]|nr:CCA tRNA nucleotidyltransferase [Candidatus Uhrbacteria bacterium]